MSPEPHLGKLRGLTPGLGAVATTFVAGVETIRRGLAEPVGSLAQMQTIRIGMPSQRRTPLIRDLVDLAPLDDLVFGDWDVFEDDAYHAAKRAAVLKPEHLDPVAGFLGDLKPMRAVFDPEYVKRLDGPNTKRAANKYELAEMLRADIRETISATGADRAVMVWYGSTEVYLTPQACHKDIGSFELGMKNDDPAIAPSQLYAYASILEGVPYANGTPNMSADNPAIEQLAIDRCVPVAGKDFKTGQTLIKTALAPAFKHRMLGIAGWFSTNILGNRDGEVLDDPESFRAKEVMKSGVLDAILEPESYPSLYEDLYHRVRINYYPPRGDEKDGWDNIDIFGWLGYPMQIKIDFLCRDSILAAPVVLDLALFMDLAGRSGFSGLQEWLSFYSKSPHVQYGHQLEHDLHIQQTRLKNTLRVIAGKLPVTHLSADFVDNRFTKST